MKTLQKEQVSLRRLLLYEVVCEAFNNDGTCVIENTVVSSRKMQGKTHNCDTKIHSYFAFSQRNTQSIIQSIGQSINRAKNSDKSASAKQLAN